MPPPPEQQPPLASSAFRLDCSTPATPPQSIKMQRHLPSLCHETAEYPDGGLVNSLSAFLWLDGVDLLFDVLHLGGKDNLPSLVIYIVLQQADDMSVMLPCSVVLRSA